MPRTKKSQHHQVGEISRLKRKQFFKNLLIDLAVFFFQSRPEQAYYQLIFLIYLLLHVPDQLSTYDFSLIQKLKIFISFFQNVFVKISEKII